MGDIVRLGACPDVETTLRELADLQRRVMEGEDLGSRMPHIMRSVAALRSLLAGLRRALDTLDPADDGTVEIREVAETVLAVSAEYLARTEGLLRSSLEVCPNPSAL